MSTKKTQGSGQYYVYLAAVLITEFGSTVSVVSIPLLVFNWSASGMILSAMMICTVIISIALGFFVGNWLKDKDLRKTWIVFAALSGIIELVVAMVFNLPAIFILFIILGFTGIFMMICYQAILTEIVKEDNLAWANNTLYLGLMLVGVIAPVVSGILLVLSTRSVIIVDAMTFLMEAIIVATFIKPTIVKSDKQEPKTKARESLVKIISGPSLILYCILFGMAIMLFVGANNILRVAYFSAYFSKNYYLFYTIGFMMMGIGEVAITLPITFLKISIKRPYRVCILACFLFGICFLGLGFFSNIFILWFMFLIMGVGNGLVAPNISTVLLKYTPKNSLRPTLGLFQTLSNSTKVISLLLGGILITLVDLHLVYAIMGLLLLLVGVLFLPTIRKENELVFLSDKK